MNDLNQLNVVGKVPGEEQVKPCHARFDMLAKSLSKKRPLADDGTGWVSVRHLKNGSDHGLGSPPKKKYGFVKRAELALTTLMGHLSSIHSSLLHSFSVEVTVSSQIADTRMSIDVKRSVSVFT